MKNQLKNIAEHRRLAQDRHHTRNWESWGPYLGECRCSTAHQGSSTSGNNRNSFSHERHRGHAGRSSAKDFLGITDRQRRLCFALALWNKREPILKERPLGGAALEGDGKDVEECCHHLDSTPTYSYAKALYKYPQADFRAAQPVDKNRASRPAATEAEFTDTPVFAENRYFDVSAEYAKAGPEDICIRITVANRGPDTETLHVLPTLSFRDTWSSAESDGASTKPTMALVYANLVRAKHGKFGSYLFGWEGETETLFTESENHAHCLRNQPNARPFAKDAFHEHLVAGRRDAVNPKESGTQCAPHFVLTLTGGETRVLKLRLVREKDAPALSFGKVFAQIFSDRKREADEFHASVIRIATLSLGEGALVNPYLGCEQTPRNPRCLAEVDQTLSTGADCIEGIETERAALLLAT
jgi:hypothetical protein